MSKSKFPDHLLAHYGSGRAFKATKRANARDVDHALDDLMTGCAFSPAYREIDEMRKLIRNVRHKISEKEWGR